MLVVRRRFSAWSWRVAVASSRVALLSALWLLYRMFPRSESGLRIAPLAATLPLIDPLPFLFYRLQDWRLQGPSSLNPTAATNCNVAGAATGLGLVGRKIISQDCITLQPSFIKNTFLSYTRVTYFKEPHLTERQLGIRAQSRRAPLYSAFGTLLPGRFYRSAPTWSAKSQSLPEKR